MKNYHVYLICTVGSKFKKTYVGYTSNLKKRILLHNSGKGAKATRGYTWKIIFKKKFHTKGDAMKFEYFLKKNKSLRKKLTSKSKLIY